MTERAHEEPRPDSAPQAIGTPVHEPDAATRDKAPGDKPLDVAARREGVAVELPRPGASEVMAAIPVGFGALAVALGALGLFAAAALWRLQAPGVYQVLTPASQLAALAAVGVGWSVAGLALARRAAWASRAAAGVGLLVLLLLPLGLPGDMWLGSALLALTLPWLGEVRDPDGAVRPPSATYLAAASWGVLVTLVLALWPELEKAATVLLRDQVPRPGRTPLSGLLLGLAGPAAVVLPAPLATLRSRAATAAAHVVGAGVVLGLALAIVRGVVA